MSVKQISVFIENKTGKLAEVTDYIAKHNINLKALCIADTQDFGILRIICENHSDAVVALKEGGYVTTETEVLAVELSDKPGSLAKILKILADADVIVEYTYAFLSVKNADHAYMIFRVDDNKVAAASLMAEGIQVVSDSNLF